MNTEDDIILRLTNMTDHYMECLWNEYVIQTISNHNIIQQKILHQHDSNILGISIATKYINENLTNI